MYLRPKYFKKKMSNSFKRIKKILLSTILAVLSMSSVFAQNSDFDAFLRAGAEDANKLIGNYLEPMIVGFSYGMSNSWYNTAKTHESFGFDITITGNLTSVPTSKEFFTFNPANYNSTTSTGSTDQIPTIMGPKTENGSELSFEYHDENSGETIRNSFSPVGIGIKEDYGYNVVPSPMVQLSVGVIKNTDIILRYTPEITAGDFKTSVFGLGIKHDIKQWIPGMKRVPIDISILGAFSGMENTFDMSNMELDGENQESVFEIDNWTVQGIVSKRFSILTFYGSFGYSNVSSSIKMKGSFKIEDTSDSSVSYTIMDPIDREYEEKTWRATGGLRLAFGILTLHGDYTWQEYPIASGGIGFSFR